MDKNMHINFWYFVLAIVGVMIFQQWWLESRLVETIPYSDFQQFLRDGKIAEIRITDTNIRGTLREALPDGRKEIYTVRVDPDFAKDLVQYGVEFSGDVDSKVVATLLSWVLPMVMFFAIWMFFVRKMAEGQGGAGGMLSIGKSKAKVYMEKDTQTTFEEVAGVDEAKDELKEIVAFLKNPEEYGRIGAHVPKGILLVGPPGTGKTLLARAVAGEAGVPFFSISGSEFVEMFVGVGAARVRDLFQQARKSAPCIIFIDELDALGRARGAGPLGGHDEKEQTLNQLLSELDGFDPQQGIVLLAATNRPEILDSALLRSGRFDRQILVDRPDKIGRIAILKVHVKKVQMDSDVDLEQIAALTAGFSGADLANLVNEAAIIATRRDADAVILDDFTAAIERIVAGLEKKNRLLNPYERMVVAYHETGHALVTLALSGTDVVQKVSIIPRGIGALGYNIQRPTEDRYLMTSTELENKMAALLGGRAAEVLVFKTLSTGASDDLDKVTEIARGMVMRYGMEETLGLATYAEKESSFLASGGMGQYQPRSYSEKTAREIDEAVRARIGKAFKKATAVLTSNRQLLEETSEKLLLKETLSAEELPQPIWEENVADKQVTSG